MVHCDFFKLDPRSFGAVKPTVDSRVLLRDLAIETLPWSKGNFYHSLKQKYLPICQLSLAVHQWCIDEICVQFILYNLWADAPKLNLAFPSHLDTSNPSSCEEAKFYVKETC